MSFGSFEVDSDRFEMPDMEISIGLGRKPESELIVGDNLVLLSDYLRIAFNFKLSWFDILKFVPDPDIISFVFAYPSFFE